MPESANGGHVGNSDSIDGDDEFEEESDNGLREEYEPESHQPVNVNRDQGDMSDDDSIAHSSQLSDATGLTSRIQEVELLRGKSEAMLDQLPDLYSAATAILTPLAQRLPTEETLQRIVQDLHSSRPTGWKRRDANLKGLIQDYGVNETVFIEPGLVVPAMLDLDTIEEIRPSAWRPDDVLFLANLAQFAMRLTSIQEPTSSDSRDWLLLLDSLFPAQFASGVARNLQGIPVGYSRLEETFNIALEVRTQVFISNLGNWVPSEGYNPMGLLIDIFSTTPIRERVENIEELEEILPDLDLKGWQIPELGSEDDKELSSEMKDLIIDRMIALGELVAEEKDRAGHFKRLQEAFPWPGFCLNCMQWIHSRFEELKRHISTVGGIDEICETLRKGVDARLSPQKSIPAFAGEEAKGRPSMPLDVPSSDEQPEQKRKSLIHLAKLLTQSTPNPSNITLPRQDFPQTTSVSTVLVPAIVSVESDDRLPSIENDEHPVASRSPSESADPPARNSVSPSSTKQGKLPSRPRLTDRQPGAQKVPSISESESEFEKPHDNTAAADKRRVPKESAPNDSRAGKRRRLEDREMEAASARAAQGTSSRKPEVKNQRVYPADRKDSEPSTITSRRRSRNAQDEEGDKEYDPVRSPANEQEEIDKELRDLGRTSDRASEAESEEGSPPSVDFRRVVAEAERKVAKHRAQRPPQLRRAWTQDEEKQLIRLIRKEGASYTRIKQRDGEEDNILEGRSQTDVKDKAKNMKMAFLK